jgi:hypothetical protein
VNRARTFASFLRHYRSKVAVRRDAVEGRNIACLTC